MIHVHKQREIEIIEYLQNEHEIYMFRISTPLPGLKINIYFVTRPVPTLIDAPPNDPVFLRELGDALRAVGYSIKDIEVIIVTHPHLDHYGSAAIIAKESGAQVWASRDTGLFLRNFEEECLEEEAFIAKSLELSAVPGDLINYSKQFFRFMKQYASGVVTSRYFEMGEAISLGLNSFVIEGVPGHTPWCIMLYSAKEQIAFTGDFLLKEISSNPLIQRPWKVPDGYKSLRAYTSSLERVARMDLKLALPGHGPLIENPKERIKDLLGLMNTRTEQIITVLRNRHNLTIIDIVREVFPELQREQLFLAISEIFAHLDVLEDESKVRRTHDFPPRFTAL
jgi:glyoxylase-like metal-dependent hydrolase (beta-lactamase superfamily II)